MELDSDDPYAEFADRVRIRPKEGGKEAKGSGSAGKKADLAEVDAAAAEAGIPKELRSEFSTYLHALKEAGEVGTKNARGDFTYQELLGVARDFLRYH